ncbi:MAG: hypothetical protein ABIX01_08905 [Chitinophagaceae bacterium]
MKILTIVEPPSKDLAKTRRWILFFIIALALSGLTALGVESQLDHLSGLFPGKETWVGAWLWKVYAAIKDTNHQYPFLSYGYDWLAFAHLVIATVFIGPLQDPVKNKWVIQFGRVTCLMVIPFALLAGSFRGLPFWWICVDCSFGIIGIIPLSVCYRLINRLEKNSNHQHPAF